MSVPIICDFGSGSSKVGFAGAKMPLAVFPTVLGKFRHLRDVSDSRRPAWVLGAGCWPVEPSEQVGPRSAGGARGDKGEGRPPMLSASTGLWRRPPRSPRARATLAAPDPTGTPGNPRRDHEGGSASSCVPSPKEQPAGPPPASAPNVEAGACPPHGPFAPPPPSPLPLLLCGSPTRCGPDACPRSDNGSPLPWGSLADTSQGYYLETGCRLARPQGQRDREPSRQRSCTQGAQVGSPTPSPHACPRLPRT